MFDTFAVSSGFCVTRWISIIVEICFCVESIQIVPSTMTWWRTRRMALTTFSSIAPSRWVAESSLFIISASCVILFIWHNNLYFSLYPKYWSVYCLNVMSWIVWGNTNHCPHISSVWSIMETEVIAIVNCNKDLFEMLFYSNGFCRCSLCSRRIDFDFLFRRLFRLSRRLYG